MATKDVGEYRVNTDPEDILGQGAFASVYPGEHKVTGEKVAAKCIKPTIKAAKCIKGITDEDGWKKINSELAVLDKLSSPGHPNILSILAHYKRPEIKPTCLWIITELCTGGTLANFFSTHKIDIDQNVSFMKQISSGLAYLHENDIVHRDVKPQNMLIKADAQGKTLKLSDFGESKLKELIKNPLTTFLIR